MAGLLRPKPWYSHFLVLLDYATFSTRAAASEPVTLLFARTAPASESDADDAQGAEEKAAHWMSAGELHSSASVGCRMRAADGWGCCSCSARGRCWAALP